MYTIARLPPGVSAERAGAEAAALAQRLAEISPGTNRGLSATVVPTWQTHQGAAQLLLEPLRILMAVSGVVFLIVCANLANLLLAVAGAVVGLPLAFWTSKSLPGMVPWVGVPGAIQ